MEDVGLENLLRWRIEFADMTKSDGEPLRRQSSAKKNLHDIDKSMEHGRKYAEGP